MDGYRLDELARRAGIASTTVRLYQQKGLLPGPHLVGRTGWYDDTHLARLALIGRLQGEGHSLAGIARLLETWQQGRDLEDVVGVEQQLGDLLELRHAIVLTVDELAARFPDGVLTAEQVQRAGRMGLVQVTDDGRMRIPDQRFVDTGSALVRLGVPVEVVLDEWAHLSEVTDDLAERFIRLFEDHLLPADWQADLTGERVAELGATLGQLRQVARQVLVAALDASIARQGSRHLGALVAADRSDEGT